MFALSKIGWSLAEPGNLLLLAMIAGALLLWAGPLHARLPYLGRRLIALAALAGLVIAALPVGEAALGPLENRFPVPALPGHIDGIIVLGTAIDTEVAAARGPVALTDNAERLTTALAIARAHPEAKLLYSGGSGALGEDEPAEAPFAGRFLTAMGLDPARLLLEGRSRNTYENALFSKALAAPQPGQVWVLVTSAFHMPRAVGVFRKLGWEVIPYPVAFKTEGRYALTLNFELADGLERLNRAAKEWIGLAAYYAMGRTSALFPAPAGA
jgi:uncharacterized SAM-binding protein YcdF (DUF218 family)